MPVGVPFNDTVVNRPQISISHPATVTTVVCIITVKQILNGVWRCFSIVCDCKKCFHSCGSSKGPTRAALTLVNTSVTVFFFGIPTDFIRNFLFAYNIFVLNNIREQIFFWAKSVIYLRCVKFITLRQFFRSHISKLIDTHFVTSILS